MSEGILVSFSPTLLAWHKTVDRPLPWKNLKDPYLIWVSEIILQQTRAQQAIPYFLKITERFPDLKSLATAPIDDLLSMWQGLGYYSRARNLHHSAQVIIEQHAGAFPSAYEDILSLKGVGKYTAAAIGSFAFDLPYPVVDGNVIRIISRVFDVDEAVDTKEGLAKINHLVEEVFNGKKAAKFNQAIMDFGATVCLPKNPKCSTCPFEENCQALHNETVLQRPIKIKKLKRKKRNFNFLLFKKGDKILIQKRTEKDIWQGLYQLPMIEGEAFTKSKKLSKELENKYALRSEINPVYTHKQLLTHQEIHSIIWRVNDTQKMVDQSGGIWVSKKKLTDFGFPKTLTLFFEDYLYIR